LICASTKAPDIGGLRARAVVMDFCSGPPMQNYCGVDRPVFLFSWRARLLGYLSDRDAVDVSAEHLKQFLVNVVGATKPTKVHVIAHSMGNMVLLRALEKMSGDSTVSPLPIGEIINAAPDVDPDLFAQFVKKTKGTGGNVTLYASASDRALWFSGWLRDRARAGYIKGLPAVITGSETIDITDAGTNVFALNHDIYASNPILVGDMRGILQGHRPPEKRTKELKRFDTEQGPYWKLQRLANP
jgi:esterase/lipase superfamily enzyme